MARGIATGFFVAYIPILGLHMLLALIFAQLIRANKALAVMAVWICNPLTFFLIYYPSYRLGHFLLPFFHDQPEVEMDQIQTLINQTFSLSYALGNCFTIDYWKQVGAVFKTIGLETFIVITGNRWGLFLRPSAWKPLSVELSWDSSSPKSVIGSATTSSSATAPANKPAKVPGNGRIRNNITIAAFNNAHGQAALGRATRQIILF
jgi:hypothetical protein